MYERREPLSRRLRRFVSSCSPREARFVSRPIHSALSSYCIDKLDVGPLGRPVRRAISRALASLVHVAYWPRSEPKLFRVTRVNSAPEIRSKDRVVDPCEHNYPRTLQAPYAEADTLLPNVETNGKLSGREE